MFWMDLIKCPENKESKKNVLKRIFLSFRFVIFYKIFVFESQNLCVRAMVIVIILEEHMRDDHEHTFSRTHSDNTKYNVGTKSGLRMKSHWD